jgi:erythrin-vacuolar iron transport family protein
LISKEAAVTILTLARPPRPRDERSFLLQRAQPAMTGLIDGSLSTLAPVFAVALATHQPRYAFFAGLATAIGAGVSMAFSEGLSDTGDGFVRSFVSIAIGGAIIASVSAALGAVS